MFVATAEAEAAGTLGGKSLPVATPGDLWELGCTWATARGGGVLGAAKDTVATRGRLWSDKGAEGNRAGWLGGKRAAPTVELEPGTLAGEASRLDGTDEIDDGVNSMAATAEVWGRGVRGAGPRPTPLAVESICLDRRSIKAMAVLNRAVCCLKASRSCEVVSIR